METRTILLLAVGLLVAGCGKGMPSEEDARGFYQTHSEVLNDIEAGVRAAIVELPAYSGEPSDTNRDAFVTAAIEANERFRFEGIAQLMVSPHLVGISVTLTSQRENVLFPGDRRSNLYVVQGTRNANMADSTAPTDGIVIDARRVGWGLGQIWCEIPNDAGEYDGYGMEGQFERLDVEWEFIEGTTHVALSVHLLADAVPPDDWREHCLLPRRPAARD